MDLFVLDTYGDTELLEREDEIEKDIQIYDNTKEEPKSLEQKVSIPGNVNVDEEEDEDVGSEEDDCGLPPLDSLSNVISQHLNSESNPLKKRLAEKQKLFNYLETIRKEKNNDINKIEIQQNLDELITRDNKKELLNAKSKMLGRTPENLAINSLRKEKKLKQIEREKTKGSNWFNMPATEITDEIENDLKILQMRSILNPKQFYKKNDLKVLPKYFQIGTVQHSPLEFYNERNIRRNKKKTIVDELLADTEVKKFTKRKYMEIIQKKQRYNYKKDMKKMKKLKKRK